MLVLADRAKKWLGRRNRVVILGLIVSGLVLTAWSGHMVVTSERMWFPPEIQSADSA